MSRPNSDPSDHVDVLIDRPVAGGRMLARHDGQVILVGGSLPGERVRARVERVSHGVAFARAVEILEPSPDRREPLGEAPCGGAVYAHIRYERQLVLKQLIVDDAFRRIGKLTLPEPVAMRTSPERGYRMRARLHIRQRQAVFFREGTHIPCDAGATGQLVDEALAAVDSTLAVLDARLAECEALILAENAAATERVIHVEPRDGARLDDLAGTVSLPAGTTGLTTGRAATVLALAGLSTVTDRAGELLGAPAPLPADTLWAHRAPSFFQGNRFLTGTLVRRVLDAAGGGRFVDLYAGVGLFAVALAAAGQRGLAVEGDRMSAADLDSNARPWTDRLRTLRTPVEEAVQARLDPAPDVVVLDPPRTGVTPPALAGVIAWNAPRVIYVSCDPPTLARDARRLVDSGYRLESIEGFDLFPNTAHVETIACFARG